MRKIIVDKIMKNINNNYNFNEVKTAEIKYGIESFYLFITKTIVILSLAFVLGIIKEILMLLFFYNLLRMSGFGVHAMKSWQCWCSSIIIFLGIPMLMRIIDVPLYLVLTISVICLLLIIKYAPADTEKRPIVSPKRRKKFKILCSLTAVVYIMLIIFVNIEILRYSLMFSLVIETFMLLPISYKIFRAKYNNYKSYLNQVQVQ